MSRASLRHMEDLDQAIKNELESMDLWDDGEECGRVLDGGSRDREAGKDGVGS